MPAPKKLAPPPAQYVPLLRLSTYSAGGFIPDGVYLWSLLDIVMQQLMKNNNPIGPPRLTVRITMEPPTGAQRDEEKRMQHYSLGSNAHLTYAADPQTGKRLVAIPGGPAAPLYETTNFHILLKSLHDAGMPEDYALDDVSVLEGIVVRITNVPEPESRKELRNRPQTTGEAAYPEPSVSKEPPKIPVVSEVISAPWMETDQATQAAPAPTQAPRTPAQVAPVATAAAPKPKTNGAPAPPPPSGDVDVREAASNAIAIYLGSNPNGAGKLKMRMDIFKSLASTPELQKSIMDTYFSDDAELGSILAECGYKLEGPNVVVG